VLKGVLKKVQEFNTKEGVNFNKSYEDNWMNKLSKPEARVLSFLVKQAKRQKTTHLTLSLGVIARRLGFTRPLIHMGLHGLQAKGVIDIQPNKQGTMIDLSRVLEGGVLLKSIDKSVKKVKTPLEKIPGRVIGSERDTSVLSNPTGANVPVSSEHTLQTEHPVLQPVESAELVKMVDNLKGCAERVKDEEILSFIKNFDFSAGYDKIYEKALELRRLLKGGKK
jgi:DNA-binding MarR family transcriptional regulator